MFLANPQFQKTLILCATIYGLLFSTIIIAKNRSHSNARFWLGIFVLSFSFVLFDNWGIRVSLHEVWPPFSYTYFRCISIIPLSIWFYVKHLTSSENNTSVLEGISWALVTLEFLAILIGVFSEGSMINDQFWSKTLTYDILGIVLTMLWLPKSISQLMVYNASAGIEGSKTFKNHYVWLIQLLSSLLLVTILWIIATSLNYFIDGILISWFWVYVSMSFIIFFIGIKGYLSPEIIHNFEYIPLKNKVLQLPTFEKDGPVSIQSTQAKSKVDKRPTRTNNEPDLSRAHLHSIPAKNKEVLLGILDLMEVDKLYQYPKLTVTDVAKKYNVSSKLVSKLINEHFKVSFSDFVNYFRIEEVKQRIQGNESSKYTILSMGLDAGFNSKSSFYYTFQRFTNMTPTEFENSLNS